MPSIGDALIAANISWKYYGDQWNNYVPDPYQLNYGAIGANTDEYCNICNPFQYDTSIMANAAIRTAHIQDTAESLLPISRTERCRRFPSSSPAAWWTAIHRPRNWISSKASRRRLWMRCRPTRALWSDTAIFITFDEGGGYYDSGYVQPLDFFGDGTRIPLIVVSPYTTRGTHLARLCGSRLHPQIHREELELASRHNPQPGQLPEPDCEPDQSVCARQ